MDEHQDRLDAVIKQVFERLKKLNPKPESCPDDQLLAAYHESRLSQEETEKLEAHLVLCERCTENLIVLSEAVSSYDSTKEPLATQGMVRKAKSLIKSSPESQLWERISSWVTSLRPIPVMATTCAFLVLMVVGIYSFYLPQGPGDGESIPARIGLIARIPGVMITRGKTPTYKEIEIQDGGLLHSGDIFKIRFKLQKDAYVYVLALNSQGHLTRLFPGKNAGGLFKAKPDKNYFVPQGDGWLKLDDKPGTETFYLLASLHVIKNIDQKINQLKTSGIDDLDKLFPGVTIKSFRFKHEQKSD